MVEFILENYMDVITEENAGTFVLAYFKSKTPPEGTEAYQENMKITHKNRFSSHLIDTTVPLEELISSGKIIHIFWCINILADEGIGKYGHDIIELVRLTNPIYSLCHRNYKCRGGEQCNYLRDAIVKYRAAL
jgi:hypothetical protein